MDLDRLYEEYFPALIVIFCAGMSLGIIIGLIVGKH